MALNPVKLIRIKKLWEGFKESHPRLLPYFRELSSSGYVGEGSVIDITVTDPDGRSLRCNIKMTENDLELIRAVSDLGKESAQ
ncbi:MAG: hypothetical protein J5744_04310 [Oscillospiraceae bacterium]|nr:hypothetical protein [Oscillospiraceae bacterium]